MFTILILVIYSSVFSQKTQEFIDYKDFKFIDEKVYAINDSGQFIIWDLNTLDSALINPDFKTYRFTAIGIDNEDQIYVGTNKGGIFKYNQLNNTLFFFKETKYYVFSIFFNAKNELYTIVPYTIYYPSKAKTWYKFVQHNSQINTIRKKKILNLITIKSKKLFRLPDISLLDSEDKLWMASSYGEFGAELQLFNISKNKYLDSKFDNLKLELLFPQSFFNDSDNNLFITSGIQHFSSSGEIIKIDPDRNVSTILDSNDSIYIADSNNHVKELFVGPGGFDKQNNTIIISTNYGFYEFPIPQPNQRVNKMKLLFKPELEWEREPMAMGSKMAVKKLKVINNKKIIFLTSSNGIGFWDGKKLNMLE